RVEPRHKAAASPPRSSRPTSRRVIVPRPASHACLLTLILGLLASPPAALAVRPSEELLPSTTKGYLSVYDVDLLEEHFNKTQMGQLAALEQMAPFVKDFRQQIRNKLNQAGA